MDAPISYAIVAGVFIAFAVICFAARAKRVAPKKEKPIGSPEERAKRVAPKKEKPIGSPEEMKRSPA